MNDSCKQKISVNTVDGRATEKFSHQRHCVGQHVSHLPTSTSKLLIHGSTFRTSSLSQEADVRMIPRKPALASCARACSRSDIGNQNSQVVSRDATSVLHLSPVGPAGRGLASGPVPDTLGPDNVVNPQASRVPHDPLSNGLSNGVVRLGGDTISLVLCATSCMDPHHADSEGISTARTYSDHQIQRQTLAVLTRLGGIAIHGVHGAWELIQDPISSRDDMRLAVVGGNGWPVAGGRGSATTAAAQAALEGGRAGAQPCLSGAAAGAFEAAVATGATAALGAASHIGRIVGAETRGGSASAARAVGGLDTDARRTVDSAGSIEGSLTDGSGEDQRGQDGMEVHGED